MTYGAETPVRFGVSLVPATESLDLIREATRAADEAGLDLVGIQDHPYQRRFLDTWALIPTLLAETRRIRPWRPVQRASRPRSGEAEARGSGQTGLEAAGGPAGAAASSTPATS